MRDYGLLQGLAAGLQGGIDGYSAAKKMQREDETLRMQKQKMEQDQQRGLIESQTKDYLARLQGEDVERKRMADEAAETNKQMEIFVKLKNEGFTPGLNEIYPYDTDSPENAVAEYTRRFPQPTGLVGGQDMGVYPMTGVPRQAPTPELDQWQKGLIDARKGTGKYKLNLRDLGTGKPGAEVKKIETETNLMPKSQKYQPKSGASNGKILPAKQILDINQFSTGLSLIGRYRKELKDNSNLFGPIAGRASGALTSIGGENIPGLQDRSIKAAKIEGLRTQMKQMVAKGIEGGVLRKEDEIKYEKMIPPMSVSPKAAEAMLNELEITLRNDMKSGISALKQSGWNTSAWSGDNGGNKIKVTNKAGVVKWVSEENLDKAKASGYNP
jgi:hypothetical protein